MTKKQAPVRGLAKRLTPSQRQQVYAVLGNLLEARERLKALISEEPAGTRDLLLARVGVERAAVVLMDCYAEPVPPAPATATASATASGEPGKKVA